MTFFWIIAILGSLAGGLTLFSTMLNATGAPQQAAGAAMACAFAVVPYVLARSIDGATNLDEAKKQTALLAQIVRNMTQPAPPPVP